MIEYQALLQNAAEKAGMTCDEYRVLIELYFEEISTQLRAGNDVLIHNSIGKIVLREHSERTVPGGVTKQRLTPVFKSSRVLKKTLVQSEDEYIAMLRLRGKNKTADSLAKKRKQSDI